MEKCNVSRTTFSPGLSSLSFFFIILQNIMSACGHAQPKFRAWFGGTQLVQSLSCISEDTFCHSRLLLSGEMQQTGTSWTKEITGGKRLVPHAPRQCLVHLPIQFYRRLSLFRKVTFHLHDDQSRQCTLYLCTRHRDPCKQGAEPWSLSPKSHPHLSFLRSLNLDTQASDDVPSLLTHSRAGASGC